MSGGSTTAVGSVLWLTSDKPGTISVGRERIADHLEDRGGFDVTVRGTTGGTVREALREVDGYDAVVGTTRAGGIAAAALKLLSGTPAVVDHVDPIRQFETTHPAPLAVAVRYLENAAFAVADHVLYVYDEERPRVGRYARSASRTDLGVEYDRFESPPREVVEAARSRLRAAGADGNVAIYVGGLEPIYHVRELLDAAERLDDWTLVVLGTGSLSEEVTARAADTDGVAYLGTVGHREVPGYLHAADVGVCLVDDPHTLKVLEYLAAGLPVVQLRGRAEGRFGDRLTYADPTPASIARAIRRADADGPADDGRAFARRFDWRRISETYREAIEAVVDHETAPEPERNRWEQTTSSS